MSALPGELKFLPPSRAVIGSWWSSSFGEWKGLSSAYIFHRLRDWSQVGVPMEAPRRFLCFTPSALEVIGPLVHSLIHYLRHHSLQALHSSRSRKANLRVRGPASESRHSHRLTLGLGQVLAPPWTSISLPVETKALG